MINLKILFFLFLFFAANSLYAQCIEVEGYFLYYKSQERVSYDAINEAEFIVQIDSFKVNSLFDSINLYKLIIEAIDTNQNHTLTIMHFDIQSLINFYSTKSHLNYEIDSSVIKAMGDNRLFNIIWYNNVNYFQPKSNEPSYRETIGLINMKMHLVKHVVNMDVEGCYNLKLTKQGFIIRDTKDKQDVVYFPVVECDN